MRSVWAAHSVGRPIFISEEIPGIKRSMEQFAMQFTLGTHRGKKKKSSE
jgi:hypothetical protein